MREWRGWRLEERRAEWTRDIHTLGLRSQPARHKILDVIGYMAAVYPHIPQNVATRHSPGEGCTPGKEVARGRGAGLVTDETRRCFVRRLVTSQCLVSVRPPPRLGGTSDTLAFSPREPFRPLMPSAGVP